LPELFSHLVDDPVALTRPQLRAWLRPHTEAGRLTQAEAVRLLLADLVFRGRQNGRTAFLVVEISWSVDVADVRRAADRATLLRKVAPRTLPVVAGWRIQDEAVELAESQQVAMVLEEEVA